MSVTVSSWVWKHSKTTGNDRLLLLAIADTADDDGDNAWPSIATLAYKATCSERTVQRRIQKLEELGCLTVLRGAGRNGTHRYRVHMDDGAKKPEKSAKKSQPTPPLDGRRRGPQPRAPRHLGGDRLSPPDKVSPGVTELRRATPDTQVSPERPERPSTPQPPGQAQGAKCAHGRSSNCRRCGTSPRGAERRDRMAAAEAAAAEAGRIERDRDALRWCGDPTCDPHSRWRDVDGGTARCHVCHPDVVVGRPSAELLELAALAGVKARAG